MLYEKTYRSPRNYGSIVHIHILGHVGFMSSTVEGLLDLKGPFMDPRLGPDMDS